MPALKRPVLERLMRYYQFICELTNDNLLNFRPITSSEIAKALEIDPTQVRKDLAAIKIRGLPRVGFDSCKVCRAIRKTLGFDRRFEAVLVGAGHLGGAILNYPGFVRYGLTIVAAFDSDHKKEGTRIGKYTVRPTKAMRSFISKRGICLALIATPGEVAQELADLLVSAGIRAIWNFTVAELAVPEKVIVRHERISLGLAELGYHLKKGMPKTPDNHSCR